MMAVPVSMMNAINSPIYHPTNAFFLFNSLFFNEYNSNGYGHPSNGYAAQQALASRGSSTGPVEESATFFILEILVIAFFLITYEECATIPFAKRR